MRADRLLALILLLQARDRMTAAQVAEALEVSVATARRDLEALSTAGVPVYGQPGRHGGWQLLGDARTDLTGFTTGDARALFGLLGTAGLEGERTRRATRKLLQALPRPLREEAETLSTSIYYDHAEWGRSRAAATTELELLRSALLQRRSLRVRYTSRGRDTYATVLWPLGLVAKAGEWYLVADAGAGPRTYRVSRLEGVELTDQEGHTPQGAGRRKDFDLAEYWNMHTQQVEQKRSGIAAVLRVPTPLVPLLKHQFGTYATVLEGSAHCRAGVSVREAPDGEALNAVNVDDAVNAVDADDAAVPGVDGAEDWCLLEVRAHLLVALAEQLAGWGGRIQVVSPAELRGELARLGAELVARYRSRD